MDTKSLLEDILRSASNGNPDEAKALAKEHFPFSIIEPNSRNIPPEKAMQVFCRDGFIDRYSGEKLVFPGTLLLLSHLLPEEFPYQKNWKISETHMMYWEWYPTVNHIVPIARGGTNDISNMVSTSMIRNSAKSHWILEELGWQLHPAGHMMEWDGLTGVFKEIVKGRAGFSTKIWKWYAIAEKFSHHIDTDKD